MKTLSNLWLKMTFIWVSFGLFSCNKDWLEEPRPDKDFQVKKAADKLTVDNFNIIRRLTQYDGYIISYNFDGSLKEVKKSNGNSYSYNYYTSLGVPKIKINANIKKWGEVEFWYRIGPTGNIFTSEYLIQAGPNYESFEYEYDLQGRLSKRYRVLHHPAPQLPDKYLHHQFFYDSDNNLIEIHTYNVYNIYGNNSNQLLTKTLYNYSSPGQPIQTVDPYPIYYFMRDIEADKSLGDEALFMSNFGKFGKHLPAKKTVVNASNNFISSVSTYSYTFDANGYVKDCQEVKNGQKLPINNYAYNFLIIK